MNVRLVLLSLCLTAFVLLAQGGSEGAKRGVFDPKLERAHAIHDSWIKDGYDFQTITDADHPYGFCMFGKPYEVKYSITIPSDSAFLRVDQQQGYAGVLCNIDHTDLEFHFTTQSQASQFMQAANSGHPILTGEQGKAECTPNKGLFKRVAVVNSSIIVAESSPFNGGDPTYAVRIRSFPAAYDHIIKSGTVQFGEATAESRFADVCNQPQGPAHFCIGLNTDEKCTAAAGPIVFYQNEYVTLECSNCWLAFSMDVGLKMKLEDFLLYDSHFLFNNMVVNGALVAEMDAQYHWGLSYDATIPIINQTNLVQFWLGPIPIVIGFELPLQRVADASFDASAHAEAGALMQWYLGAYQVLWDPIEGWRANTNEPGLKYKTVIEGDAQFSGSANFGLAPSLTAYLDSFFTTEVEFSAMLHANVQGSTTTKQVCANVNYEVFAEGSATLDISIPWVDLDESWSWSKTWFSRSGTIAQACVGANATTDNNTPQQPKLPKLPSTPTFPPKTLPTPRSLPQHHQQRPVVPSNGPTKFLQGQHSGCLGNRGYSMSYDVVMEESYNLVDLPTLGGLRKLECNAGGNTFRLEFHSDSYLKSFSRQVAQYTTFLTGNKDLSDKCHGLYDTTVFLFRVQQVTDTSIPLIKYQVEVQVAPANYDEVFRHANMSFSPDSSVECSGSEGNTAVPQLHEHVCLGVNTNGACDAAKKDLMLYKSDQLSVDCTNCFFALSADLFFELKIKDYWLSSLSGGFSNMNLDAAMVLDVIAKMQWNSGTNITEDAVSPTTIVDFMLGPIPVRIWFEIPLRRLAEVQVDVAASVTAGVTTQWNIGDYYVSYEEGKGWTHATPHPNLYWKPHIQDVSASFNASALLGLIPTFGFHVDSVFWTELTLDPELLITANGSLATKQMCAAAQSHVTATAYAELDINVPFIYLHIGAWWGPETIYDSGVHQIGSVCHTFAEPEEDVTDAVLTIN